MSTFNPWKIQMRNLSLVLSRIRYVDIVLLMSYEWIMLMFINVHCLWNIPTTYGSTYGNLNCITINIIMWKVYGNYWSLGCRRFLDFSSTTWDVIFAAFIFYNFIWNHIIYPNITDDDHSLYTLPQVALMISFLFYDLELMNPSTVFVDPEEQ